MIVKGGCCFLVFLVRVRNSTLENINTVNADAPRVVLRGLGTDGGIDVNSIVLERWFRIFECCRSQVSKILFSRCANILKRRPINGDG
jgi:hypothetical protein